jgi:hypothetical protein
MREFGRIGALQQGIERQQRLRREYGRMDMIGEEIRRQNLLGGAGSQLEVEWRRQERLEQQLRAELVAARAPTQEYLRQLEGRIGHLGSGDLSEYLTMKRLAIQGAVSPIIGHLPYESYPRVVEAFGRLNTAVAGSSFVGELEIEDATEEGGESSDSVEAQRHDLEEQLVAVVPADVLSKLKSVDFFPLSALDEILRSPDAMRFLSAHDFERFTAALIDQLGFEDVKVTPRSGDQGRDILAVKRLHGISILFAFECKRYKSDSPVGPDILRALLGTMRHGRTEANKGVLVTTSTFTSGARNFLLTEPAIDGRDFDGIVEWLKEYGSKSR